MESLPSNARSENLHSAIDAEHPAARAPKPRRIDRHEASRTFVNFPRCNSPQHGTVAGQIDGLAGRAPGRIVEHRVMNQRMSVISLAQSYLSSLSTCSRSIY